MYEKMDERLYRLNCLSISKGCQGHYWYLSFVLIRCNQSSLNQWLFISCLIPALGEFNNVKDAGTRARAYDGATLECSEIVYKPGTFVPRTRLSIA